MTIPTLQITHCVLRPLSDSDVSTLYKLINDPEVLHNMSGMKMFAESLVSSSGLIQSFFSLAHKEYGYLWGIEHEGRLSGLIGIMDLPSYPLIFYTVAEEIRNHGIATEAIAKICEFARLRGVEIISADVRVTNTPSIKALEKNHFLITAISDDQYTLSRFLICNNPT